MASNNIVPIPQTLGRLSQYIAVSAAIWDGDLNNVASSSFQELGTIEEFSLKVGRETTTWREFSSTRPGLSREVVPGLPTYSVTLSKIMLNKDLQNGLTSADTLMTLFGFNSAYGAYNNGFDIISQDKPLLIQMQLLSPRDAAGNTVSGYPAPQPVIFASCWFDSFPMKFGVADTGAMVAKQETNFKAAFMIVP